MAGKSPVKQLDLTFCNQYRGVKVTVCATISGQFNFLGNQARYEFIELDMSTALDQQIELGKPSLIGVSRSRYINRPR